MVKNLKRFRKQLEREAGKTEAAKCDFFPKTFEMPCEYHLFVEEFRKNPGITWIMKPVSASARRGRTEVWCPRRAPCQNRMPCVSWRFHEKEASLWALQESTLTGPSGLRNWTPGSPVSGSPAELQDAWGLGANCFSTFYF